MMVQVGLLTMFLVMQAARAQRQNQKPVVVRMQSSGARLWMGRRR